MSPVRETKIIVFPIHFSPRNKMFLSISFLCKRGLTAFDCALTLFHHMYVHMANSCAHNHPNAVKHTQHKSKKNSFYLFCKITKKIKTIL